jgi:hypothetical protein
MDFRNYAARGPASPLAISRLIRQKTEDGENSGCPCLHFLLSRNAELFAVKSERQS